jgi:hypothetical protein
MAAIVSATSGLSNVGATWVGGIVPVEGDTVTIALTHVVTITGTHIWGNDSATPALTYTGSCVFSTVANTDLTLKGTLINSGTVAVWQRGTIASPMPAGITSIIRTNYSAVLANNKYNIGIGTSTRFTEWSECGATRNRQFQVAAAISIGATSITVSDATGYAVGDIIFLEATNTTAAQREHRVLTSVAGNVLGWTTGLTNARIAGAWGGNISSNVLWQSYSGSFGAYVHIQCQATQAPATINIKQIAFFGLYAQNDLGGFAISGTNAVTAANSALGVLDNLAGSDLLPNGTNGVSPFGVGVFGVRTGYSGNWTYLTIYSRQGYVGGLSGVYTAQGGTGFFTNAFFCGVRGIVISAFGAGGAGCKMVNSRFTNNTQVNDGNSNIGFSMQNTVMDGSALLQSILPGDYTYDNCSFGQTYGFLSTNPLITNSNNSLATLNFNNCLFPSTTVAVVSPTTYQNALPNKPVTLLNKNADVTLQEIYLNTGSIIRDNVQLDNSRSSIKFSPYIASTAHGYSFNVSGSTGLPLTFQFGLRYDATYGATTPPSVTVSGLGIAPQTFTAGGAVNTDYAGVITVTPLSSGVLTIAISGTTTSALGTGNYWFSGMSVNPFIDWTQWYGYAYAPTIPTLTVDPVVVLSEAAASVLAGISFAAGTLTVSGTLSISNVYDWMKWYEATNRLDPIITSADGKTFILASNILVAGTLTLPSGATLVPSGTITLTGALTGAITGNVAQATPTALNGVTITGNLTYNTNVPITVILTNCTITGSASNSGTALVTITKVNTTIGTVGANVATQQFATISAPNLLIGSRVRVYNVTDSLELFNGILPGAGFSQSFQYTADKTVTLTATYSSGATAMLGVSATGVFTATGVSFLNSQVADAVYNFYAINGSAVLGFGADYVNDEVNLTTASNFSAASLYAWWVYNETTSQGIAEFFGGIEAQDAANLEIQVPIVDLYLDNTTATFVYQTDTIRIFRTDSAYPARTITSGGGGISVNWSSNVYVGTADIISAMNASPPDVNIAKINGIDVDGDGTEAVPWGPV